MGNDRARLCLAAPSWQCRATYMECAMFRVFLLIFLSALVAPARADEVCAPKLAASVGATLDADQRLLVPVVIDGKPTQLALSTGDAWSALSAGLVERQGFKIRKMIRKQASPQDTCLNFAKFVRSEF